MDEEQCPGNEARQVIARRWPSISRCMGNTHCSVDLQLDQSGPTPTLSANGIRLASAWEPDREAQLQCGAPLTPHNDLTLFGVGMGYLPPLLLQQLPPDSKLKVVPLNLGLFDRMLDVIEMQDWLKDPAVELVSAASYQCLPKHFRITPPLLQLVQSDAESLRDWLLQALSETHMQTHQSNVQDMLDNNIQANLALHLDDEDVAQCWSHTSTGNQKAVVVGAGPSLDLALPVICDLQSAGAKVVAVDAALASLMRRDILPDIVVCIDPLDTISRFFEVDLERLTETALVYFPTVSPAVVQSWPHRRFAAVGRHARYEAFARIKPTSALFSSGSVIHPAVDLATRMGATQIHLAGVDFGYPFKSTHAGGVAGALDSGSVASSQLSVRNYLDEAVPSQMNFISYYRDLEQFIAIHVQRGVEFRNIGHFSARIRHVSVIPLAA